MTARKSENNLSERLFKIERNGMVPIDISVEEFCECLKKFAKYMEIHLESCAESMDAEQIENVSKLTSKLFEMAEWPNQNDSEIDT